ncbi:RNA 2',3'-cyclic phosphodiesterase [Candidatus Daviesbacteria bacterium]|nr:RNA 2',3'-cyclic phosphodiesterase [Candidatus Daviesbacteria bacterium]
MRFFIALELSETNREQLLVVQQQLKAVIPEAKLTDNDKLHLTIAFIGEQDEKLKEPLAKIMKQAASGISPFEVTPSYIDGFPHFHTANIIWVGVKDDIDKLYLLRHRIKDQLTELNLEVDERRYVPHIAIAKVANLHLTKSQENQLTVIMSRDFDPIEVSAVKLFESIPNHGFHQHNTLAEIPLAVQNQ